MMQSLPENESKATVSPATSELRREAIKFGKLVLWFLAIFFGLRTFVVEGYQVQGASMEPTLENNERILVLKLPHLLERWSPFRGLDTIHTGDIVVFESPTDGSKRYVKRVIAEGPSAPARNTVQAQQRDTTDRPNGVIVLIDDEGVWVDNHRLKEPYLYPDPGTIREDRVRIELSAGECFVMGDHRRISKDSRRFGAVAERDIIGTALLRFWPLNRLSLF